MRYSHVLCLSRSKRYASLLSDLSAEWRVLVNVTLRQIALFFGLTLSNILFSKRKLQNWQR